MVRLSANARPYLAGYIPDSLPSQAASAAQINSRPVNGPCIIACQDGDPCTVCRYGASRGVSEVLPGLPGRQRNAIMIERTATT